MRAAFVPLLSGAADLIENAALLSLVGKYPAPLPGLGPRGDAVTAIKLGLVYAGVAICLGVFLWWLFRRLRVARA